MRKKKVWIPLLVAGLALISIPFLLGRNSDSAAVQYQTSTVAVSTLTSTITGSGNLFVDSTATISPTISGTVNNLKVALGDAVTKGQTLFTIDDSGQLDATVTKASASITQAKQSLENARTQLLQAQQDVTDANDRNTANAGSVSDSELAIFNQKVVSAQASVEVATNSVTTAQSDYKVAKANAAKRTVTAPIDGTITTLAITNGDTVGSSSSSSTANGSSSAAMVIDNLGTLKAQISLNEVDAIVATSGQKASLTFDAIDGLSLTGQVESVAVAGTVSNGVVTYNAIVALDTQNAQLRPQMTTTATITTAVRQNVITVPTTAIKTTDDVSYVQIMESGVPRSQEVTLGISSDTDTEITAGLEAGLTIVTSTVNSTSSAAASSSTQMGGGLGGGTRVMGGVPGLF